MTHATSLTMAIVRILSDGVARSNEELAEMTGRTREEVRYALIGLKKSSYAESDPVRYRITPAGLKRAEWTHKSPERQAYLAEYRQRKRDRAAAATSRGPSVDKHPLAMVWGGTHAA